MGGKRNGGFSRLHAIPGVAAIADLLVRFGDEVLASTLAGTSLAVGAGVLELSQWLVFTTTVAVVAPRLYPPPLRDVVAPVPVRSCFAVFGVCMAISLDDPETTWDVMAFLASGVGLVAVTGLLVRAKGLSPFDADGTLVAGLNWFLRTDESVGAELRRIENLDGRLRVGMRWLFGLSTLIPLVVPMVIAALVVLVLADTFPFPDVLVLAYVAGAFVAAKTGVSSSSPDALAIDSYLLSFGREAAKGLHGTFLLLLFSVGIFSTVGLPAGLLGIVIELLLTVVGNDPVSLASFNVVGVHLLWVGAVLYGFWFWARMVPRITVFLERWNGQPIRTPLAARPTLLTLPSALATALASLGLRHGLTPPGEYAFALSWPLGLVALGYVVVRTRRRHPTRSHGEDFVLVGAVLLSVFSIPGVTIASGTSGSIPPGEAGLVAGAIAFVGLLGRVSRYSERHDYRYGDGPDDERRFATPAYLLVGGLYALLVSGYLDYQLRVLTLAIGVLLLVSGTALAASSYYRPGSTRPED